VTAEGVRKLTLPIQQMEDLREYAWRHRTTVSAILRDVIQQIAENPNTFNATPQTHGLNSGTITFYCPDSQWVAAKESAGTRMLSQLIRRGANARLASEKHAA
jgi:hypothetical protein